jgi:hypothetical protein
MKLHVLPIAAVFLASCSVPVAAATSTPQPPPTATEAVLSTMASSPTVTVASTPQPPPTATQDVVSTIVASGPMIEVFFDGSGCTVSGPSEVPAGNLIVRLTNTSGPGHLTTPWVGRLYPGKTWQDYVDWIGVPGSYHHETPDWFAIPTIVRQVSESPTVSYRLYSLAMVAEYNLTVESPGDHFWPCGPFNVVASP